MTRRDLLLGAGAGVVAVHPFADAPVIVQV